MLILAVSFACKGDDTTGVPVGGGGGDLAMIIDHSCCDISTVPTNWVRAARDNLVIAYGHTSHGSQLVSGMDGLVGFAGSDYCFDGAGTGGCLELRGYAELRASDGWAHESSCDCVASSRLRGARGLRSFVARSESGCEGLERVRELVNDACEFRLLGLGE